MLARAAVAIGVGAIQETHEDPTGAIGRPNRLKRKDLPEHLRMVEFDRIAKRRAVQG